MLALALVLEGRNRTEAARAACVDRQTMRDWVHLYNKARLAGMRNKPIELCGQDEARVGQQGSPTYVWVEKGSRLRAPRDQRYDPAYLFGAVCPARGVGAGLLPPFVNAAAMNLHLAEISKAIAPGAHAVIAVDGAGWRQTGGRLRARSLDAESSESVNRALRRRNLEQDRINLIRSCSKVPDNISLLPLPPYSPELNSVENIWQFLRQNHLSNSARGYCFTPVTAMTLYCA